MAGVAKLLATSGTQVVSGLGMDGLVLVTAQAGADPKAVDAAFCSNPNVQWCEANAAVTVTQTPNDTYFNLQWDMQNTGQTDGTAGADIKAPAAWDISTGSAKVVVAVIDTGVDYNHPDLYQNIWINQAEIPASRRANLTDVDGDGLITFRDLNNPINQGSGKITDVNNDGVIDAADILAPMQVDANGNDLGGGGWAHGSTQDGNVNYPDDLIGWNFVTNTNDPMDDYGHGTHVAGTIAAEGNNGQGVAGVNWSASIMPLEFINQYGWGWLSDAVSAINYATMMRTDLGVNVRVTNNSWGGGGYYQSLYDAIAASGQAGILFACAAGNYASNNDSSAFYPASYHLDNMIVVAATDANDNLASFSNYGPTTVDLAAPGVNIPSTWPNGYWGVYSDYAYMSGTSMATPHVSGVAALAWSIDPNATVDQIRAAILVGVDPLSSLAGVVASGGRLDAAGALEQLGMHVTSSTPQQNEVVAAPPTDFTIHFAYPCDPATLAASDLTVNNIAADSVTLDSSDTSAVFHFDNSPVTGQGPQVMAIAAAVKSSDDSMTLFPWQATFYYATAALAVASTTPGEGESPVGAPTEIVLAFNAPIVTTSLDTDDLILSEGQVTSATQVDSHTIAFGVTGLTDAGLVTYTLKAGAVTDAYGTPGPAYSGGFSLDRATTHCYTAGDLSQSIPAGESLTSTLAVPDSLTVTDLEVQLDLASNHDGNLTATLTAPDGTTSFVLFSGVGGCGQGFTATVLAAEAPRPLFAAQPPFTGEFQPACQLSAFDGVEAQGNWTLTVSDDSASDVGTLYDWAIVVGAGIQGVPPILRISQQYVTATAGQDLSLPQIGTFSHPYVQTGFSYSIDWGDYSTPDTGTTANGGGTGGSTAAIISAGTPGDYTIGTIGGDHTYAEAGTYYAEVTVSDAEGNSDAQTMQVVMNGLGPVFPDDGSPLNVVQATTPLPNNGQDISDETTALSISAGTMPDSSQTDISLAVGDVQNTGLLVNSSSTQSQGQGVLAGQIDTSTTPTGMTSGGVTVQPDSEQDTTTGDPALLAAVRQALDLPVGAPVTVGEWGRLTTLSADSNQVQSLNGIQNAVNLQSFSLVPTDFSKPGSLTSLSLLSVLSNLKSLTLQDCGLNDTSIGTLPSLSALQTLDIRYNDIDTVPSAVAAETNLTSLLLYGNPLNTSPVSGSDPTPTWCNSLRGKLLTVDIAPQDTTSIIAKIDPTQPTNTYKAVAAAFYNLPIEIYQYLLNTIKYQPYQGAMKGPLAVLQTGAGNEWDTDSLLVQLYAQAGVTGLQYVTTTVTESVGTLELWLGVTAANAVGNVLADGGFNPVGQATGGNITSFQFVHTWLEKTNVTIPGVTGTQTIYLDPTWKFRDFQAGVSGLLTAVPFNEQDYLSQIRSETTCEYYEDEVRSYLAANDPNVTIADVPYDGPIHPQVLTALPIVCQHPNQTGTAEWDSADSPTPAAYTYSVQLSVAVPQGSTTASGGTYNSGTTPITASSGIFTPGMVNSPVVISAASGDKAFLITSYSSSTQVTVAGNAQRLSGPVAVCNLSLQDGTTLSSATYSSSTNTTTLTASTGVFSLGLVNTSLVMDSAGGSQRFLITSYLSPTQVVVQGNASAYQGHYFALSCLTRWYNVPDISLSRLTIGYTGNTPHLYLNGADPVLDTQSFSSGNLKIIVQITQPSASPSDGTYQSIYTRPTGQYVAIGLDAYQTSPQMLSRLQAVVNNANIADKDSANSANTDQLIGGLLYLAIMQHFNDCEQARQIIDGLTEAVPKYEFIVSGLTTGDTTLQTFPPATAQELEASLQIPFLPQNMSIDVQGGAWRSISITGDDSTTDNARDNLVGYNDSSMEATIWEELTNAEAASTVKAIQYASANNIPMDTFTSSTDGSPGTNLFPNMTTNENLAVQVSNSIRGYIGGTTDQVYVPSKEAVFGTDQYGNPTTNESLVYNGWIGVGYLVEIANSNGWFYNGFIIQGFRIDNGTALPVDAPCGGYFTSTPAYTPPAP